MRVIASTAERLSASVVVRLWGIAPVGEGLTGRGVEHPPPLSRRVTGNGFQCEQSTTPASRRFQRLLPPPQGGGQCLAIAPDTVHGEQELDFGEGDRVYGREVVCFRGSASMGNRPRGGGGSPGRGVEHPPPLSLCLWLNVFRLTIPSPPLSSMPSRKKPHHAAVTRGIPHEDGGSIFIQIPVTPRNLSMEWTRRGLSNQ